MSLPRDRHPGSKLTSLTQNDGDFKIDGKFAIGFENGQLVDQFQPSVMDQGLASGFFNITRMAGGVTNTSSLNMRLESDRIHGKTGDYGVNLNFVDTELGDVAAYTYKKASIDGAIKYLADFVNDTNNSQHILYHYIAQLAPIFGIVGGTTPLGSSSTKEDAKRAVLSNLATYSSIIGFPSNEEFNSIIENYKNDPTSYYSLENTIRLRLDLSKINPSFTEPFDLVIDFNGTETSFINLRIENLKWDNKYAFFDIGIIDAYDNGTFDYKKAIIEGFTLQLHNKDDLNNKGYIDLSDLPLLLKVGINTTKSLTYHFSGTFKYLLYQPYKLDFYINVSDKINPETGMFYVRGYISMYYASLNYSNVFHSYVYIKEDTVYFKKINEIRKLERFQYKNKGNNIEYFKCTTDDFVANLDYYLCIYMLEDNDIYNTINNNQGSSIKIKPLDMIKNFRNDSSKSQFTIGVDGNLFGIFNLKGNISLNYDPIDFVIKSFKVNVSVWGIGVEIDMNMQSDTAEILNNYSTTYDSLIETFNSNPNTSGLNFKKDPTTYTPETSYKVTTGSFDFAGIGEIILV